MKTRRRVIIVILGVILSLGMIADLLLQRHQRLYKATILPSRAGGYASFSGIAIRGSCHCGDDV